MSLTSPVAVLLNMRRASSAAVRRGRSLISTSSAGGILCSASVMTSCCAGEGAAKPIQRLDGRDDVVALLVQRADERVEAS